MLNLISQGLMTTLDDRWTVLGLKTPVCMIHPLGDHLLGCHHLDMPSSIIPINRSDVEYPVVYLLLYLSERHLQCE